MERDGKSRKRGVSLESLALMCIYMALIQSEVPRPMKDLCCLTNIDQDKVWQYLKTYDPFYRPSLMFEYFLHSLNLTYKELKEIREKVKQLEKKFVFSPNTLIAACAYAFLREKQCKSDQEKPKSLSQLAQQLGVSSMALSRCVKKIKNYWSMRYHCGPSIQLGAGLGSIFSSLFRSLVPVPKGAAKTIGKIAKNEGVSVGYLSREYKSRPVWKLAPS